MEDLTETLSKQVKRLKPYRWYIAAMAIGAFIGSNGVLVAIIAALFLNDPEPPKRRGKVINHNFRKVELEVDEEEHEEAA